MRKLKGALPIPSLTATILPAIGRQRRQVVIHGDAGWKRAIASPNRMRVHHCANCGEANHNSRSCAKAAR